MEGEYSFYGGGQFLEGRMVAIEIACLMEGNDNVREVASLKEGEWSLQRWSV